MKSLMKEKLEDYKNIIGGNNSTRSEELYFFAGFRAAELLKTNEKEFVKGRYKYTVKEFCKNNHKGFWHNCKGCFPNVRTETINCDDYWWKRVYSYPCGYEKEIKRYQLKELE